MCVCHISACIAHLDTLPAARHADWLAKCSDCAPQSLCAHFGAIAHPPARMPEAWERISYIRPRPVGLSVRPASAGDKNLFGFMHTKCRNIANALGCWRRWHSYSKIVLLTIIIAHHYNNYTIGVEKGVAQYNYAGCMLFHW